MIPPNLIRSEWAQPGITQLYSPRFEDSTGFVGKKANWNIKLLINALIVLELDFTGNPTYQELVISGSVVNITLLSER
jgi:hypothetical protein